MLSISWYNRSDIGFIKQRHLDMNRLVSVTAALSVSLAVFLTWSLPANAVSLGENNHIQMSFIHAPISDSKGRSLSPQPVTPVLTVPTAEHAAIICRAAPRIKDAILTALFSKPLIFDRKTKKFKLEGVSDYVTKKVNENLGKVMVSEVHFQPGGKTMAKGAMGRLPFATMSGCARVMEEFEERVKKLRGIKDEPK